MSEGGSGVQGRRCEGGKLCVDIHIIPDTHIIYCPHTANVIETLIFSQVDGYTMSITYICVAIHSPSSPLNLSASLKLQTTKSPRPYTALPL